MHSIDPIFIVVDLFCGAGGTTTGFVQAQMEGQRVAKVIACVNHDHKAIKSHWANHPDVTHYEEDIRTLDLTDLTALVEYWKCIYPDALLVLWASLECTNFSKAKGGQPRNADSRTLADHLERYIQAISPDYVQIENVVEFMSWGPLDDKGKPVSRKNGSDWMRWRNEICEMGYADQWKELNSANYGAYTSRNRLFGCFAKDGLPVTWPEATHAKQPSKFSMYGDLQKWKAVKEVLNFSDEGESIFTRKKPLSDRTLERILAGLIKYVAKGDSSFISKYYSGRPEGKVISTDGPAGTICTVDNQALVNAEFIVQRNSGEPKSKLVDIDGPARTLTATGGNQELVQPEFLLKYNSMTGKGVHIPPSVEEPCHVVSCQGRLGLVQPIAASGEFMYNYYGNSFTTSPEDPSPVVTTADNKALVQPFILNPGHGGHNTSTEAPCPVIIARQDKAPLYVVQIENGPVAIAVFDCDTPIMVKIKQFMAVYGLVDINMRMLRVVELLRIQGFPENYQLEGNQSDHKKFIGNSVVPQVVKCWVEAMALKVHEHLKSKAA